MDRLRHTDVVGLGSGVRAVDLRQPGPESGCDLQALRRAVRRRTAQRAAQARHSFHILIRNKHTSNRITFVFTMKESVLFTPGRIGPLTLRNRTIRAAAFEGMCDGNSPTDMLYEYHRSVAARRHRHDDARLCLGHAQRLSFPHQLWLRPEIVPGLRRITDAIHREGAAAGIQILATAATCRTARSAAARRSRPRRASTSTPPPSCEACARAKSPTWPRFRHGRKPGPRSRVRLGRSARRARIPDQPVPGRLTRTAAKTNTAARSRTGCVSWTCASARR